MNHAAAEAGRRQSVAEMRGPSARQLRIVPPDSRGRAAHSRPAIAPLVIISLTLAAVTYLRGLELVPVAVLPNTFSGTWPCGDANRNRKIEIYGTAGYESDSMLIYEDVFGDSFREIRPVTRVSGVFDFAYADGDSLADLLCGAQSPGMYQVLEAPLLDTFPSEVVWTVVPVNDGNFAKFDDLNQDGRSDIVIEGDGIEVYEWRGDKQWEPVPFPAINCEGQFTTGDYDRDGHKELITGNSNGSIYAFECAGQDSYALQCSIPFYPNEIESYGFGSARDVDGVPEFIAMLLVQGEEEDSVDVRVYKEPQHGQYECVWRTGYPCGSPDNFCVATGDPEGIGVDEFAVSSGADIRLFKPVKPDSYVQVWQYNRGNICSMRFFDVNHDGRDELVISPCSTYIFEDTVGLSSITEFNRPPKASRIAVQPTIAALGRPMTFSGLPSASEVEVYSITGQLVRRQPIANQTTWLWDLRDNQGRALPAGTYFSTVRSKGTSTQLKLCIVR